MGGGLLGGGGYYMLVAIAIDADKPHIHSSLELLPEDLILFLSPGAHLVYVSACIGAGRPPG